MGSGRTSSSSRRSTAVPSPSARARPSRWSASRAPASRPSPRWCRTALDLRGRCDHRRRLDDRQEPGGRAREAAASDADDLQDPTPRSIRAGASTGSSPSRSAPSGWSRARRRSWRAWGAADARACIRTTARSTRTSFLRRAAPARRHRAGARLQRRLHRCERADSALDVSVQAQIPQPDARPAAEVRPDLPCSSRQPRRGAAHGDAHRRDVLGRLVEVSDAKEMFARPRHPYTRMLLDAVPDLAMSGRARIPVAGEIPNPINPPSGCTFHPRCPLAFDRCRAENPLPLDGVACHAVHEGARWRCRSPPPDGDQAFGAEAPGSPPAARMKPATGRWCGHGRAPRPSSAPRRPRWSSATRRAGSRARARPA